MAVPWLFDPHYFHRLGGSSWRDEDDWMVFLFFWLFLIGQIVMAVVAGYVIGALGGLPRPLWSGANCVRFLLGFGAGLAVYIGVPVSVYLLCRFIRFLSGRLKGEDGREDS